MKAERIAVNKMLEEALPRRNEHQRVIDHVSVAPAEVREVLKDYDIDGSDSFVEQQCAIFAAAWITALNQAADRRDAASEINY